MAKYITFALAALCLILATPSWGMSKDDGASFNLFEMAQDYISDQAERVNVTDQGLTFDMDGYKSGGDTFRLFVSPTTGLGYSGDPTPEQLNNIEPAAGVKLTIPFD